MDSTARSREMAHEKVKLEPYGMSLKKVPVEEVKRQQGVQIKREYMIPYTSQELERIVQENESFLFMVLDSENVGYPISVMVNGRRYHMSWRMHAHANTIFTRSSALLQSCQKGDNCCYIFMKTYEKAKCVVDQVKDDSGYYPIRLASTVAGYLGVSVDGSEPIFSYEISFMDMGCASVDECSVDTCMIWKVKMHLECSLIASQHVLPSRSKLSLS
eukprot:Gb_36343 [translate_table: standard]